jgi:hypothetical protein
MHIRPAVLGAIMDHFTSGAPLMADGADTKSGHAAAKDDDSPLVTQIKDILDTRVRPAVAQDGGDIVFHGFEEGVAENPEPVVEDRIDEALNRAENSVRADPKDRHQKAHDQAHQNQSDNDPPRRSAKKRFQPARSLICLTVVHSVGHRSIGSIDSAHDAT